MSFRIEQKIPASLSQAHSFLEDIIDRGASRLHPNRTVRSTYFDSDDIEMYHQSEEGLLPRKKYRIRTYPNDEVAAYLLEKKISSVEGRFKTSEVITAHRRRKLLNEGIFDLSLGHVVPVLIVQYDREYYLLNGIRITIDTNIQYTNPKSLGEMIAKDPMCVIELKCGFGQDQTTLEDILSSQRGRFSKYCRGIQYTRRYNI